MKGPARSVMGKKLEAEAEELVWTRAVIRAAVLIALAFGGAWWWADTPWPGRDGLATAADPASDLSLRQAAYLGWAAMVILIPAYYAFWSRNRSARARRTWRAHWTLGFWLLVLHMVWSSHAAFGWDFAVMAQSPRVAVFWPVPGLLAWWLFDIWLAARQEEETRWSGAQRLILGLVVLGFHARAALWGGGTLVAILIGATLFASALISAQDAWKKRGRS